MLPILMLVVDLFTYQQGRKESGMNSQLIISSRQLLSQISYDDAHHLFVFNHRVVPLSPKQYALAATLMRQRQKWQETDGQAALCLSTGRLIEATGIAPREVLLFALGFLVIVMYRQVGFLQNLKNISSDQEGLPIGERAPSFTHIPIKGDVNVARGFAAQGQWTLLLFLDPGCVSCQSALHALEKMAAQLSSRSVHSLIITSAEPAVIAAVDAFSTSFLDISRVSKDVSTKMYRTRITPYGYLIDPAGIIRAKGVIADGSSIQKLVRKVDRNAIPVELAISRE